MKNLMIGTTAISVLAASLAIAQEPPANPQATYLRQGKDIALTAKAALGSKLQQAMSTGGPIAALEFCHENALPLTDSVSREQNASVKRVSDRPRNPANAANERELAYIATASSALAAGEQPKPAMTELEGRMVGYYPIVTNGMCLQCHGTPGQELSNDTQAAIDALYPDDQAINYGLNELRGVFVIGMKKE